MIIDQKKRWGLIEGGGGHERENKDGSHAAPSCWFDSLPNHSCIAIDAVGTAAVAIIYLVDADAWLLRQC